MAAPTTYKSIKSVAPVNRMGGTKQFIFAAPLSAFNVLAQPPTGKYTITAPHTFLEGLGFVQLYVTKDTGELKLDTIGGPDRHSFSMKGSFYHPGESDDIVAFANLAKLEPFILLVPLPGSNELLQVGGFDFQADLKPSYDTTKNSGDGRGWTFEYECFEADMLKYTGAVTMQPTV